jgi:hypothetical protein
MSLITLTHPFLNPRQRRQVRLIDCSEVFRPGVHPVGIDSRKPPFIDIDQQTDTR